MGNWKMKPWGWRSVAAGCLVVILYSRSTTGRFPFDSNNIVPKASNEQLFGIIPTSRHSMKYAHAMSGINNHAWGRNELVNTYANASTREVSMSRMRSGSLVDMNPSSDLVKVDEASLPPNLPEQTDDTATAIGSAFVKTRASMDRLLS